MIKQKVGIVEIFKRDYSNNFRTKERFAFVSRCIFTSTEQSRKTVDGF